MLNHPFFHPHRLTTGLLLVSALAAGSAQAAKSDGCEGGGFTVLGRTATQDQVIAAADLGETFRVQGRYVQFDVVASTLGIRNYAFLPTTNALDMTRGVLTPVYES